MAHRRSRALGRSGRRGLIRRLAAAGLALALSACGGGELNREPFADSRVPPNVGAAFLQPDGWAWGYIQVGDAPVQRYGVSSPPVRPRAQVIILPSYGESAEGWFETARDLNARGFNVWVLEAAGQGGSGRLTNRRDVGHAANLALEAEAVRAFVSVVVRPGGGQTIAVIASGTAAPVGLAVGELPRSPITLLVLSGPETLPAGSTSFLPSLPTSLAPGQAGWTRPDLSALPSRHAAAANWMIANPDLRMGGYTRGYQAAWRTLSGNVTQADALRRIRARVTVIGPDDGALCRHIRHCSTQRVAGPLPYHLAADTTRSPWLEALAAAVQSPNHDR